MSLPLDHIDDHTVPYLGEELLRLGVISNVDLEKALAFHEQLGGKLTNILIRIGAVSEDRLLAALSSISKLPVWRLADIPVELEKFQDLVNIGNLEIDWWLDQEIFAWTDDKVLWCVSKDTVSDSIEEVLTQNYPEYQLQFGLVQGNELERVLEQISRQQDGSLFMDSDVNRLRALAEEAPVIEFVNNLLSQGFEKNASDVHIEPKEHDFDVRYRIDGILFTQFTLGIERFAAAASRIKLISNMDIAERRLPQDGRLSIRLSGEDVDIRVSSVPGVYGESIVMRLLPKERKGFSLESLGLAADHLQYFKQLITEPHGILLVTGPTGSGKSTTLYSLLEAINDRRKKIITVEDPVEYRIPGITQIQVHSEIAYKFSSALRAILRQDPDIIMIGEIRDLETAEIAVQSSLTGHLVLSTLHTNDAIGAFSRLIDMGVEPFLVATPIRAVLAQRLVRRLCPECAEEGLPLPFFQELGTQLAEKYLPGIPPAWKNAKGCSTCQGTGYRTRVGIYEIIPVGTQMQELILKNSPAADMLALARQQGCRTMREDGLLKAYQGITSVEEVLRVTTG
jgi:general secretion pathway protein E